MLLIQQCPESIRVENIIQHLERHGRRDEIHNRHFLKIEVPVVKVIKLRK